MRLQSGSRLGPYEIVAIIGAGGMGEVYRATDTNLKRQVAIKVLPDAVAGDPERLVRFQREAEVLALLNHPNIAQIYGLEKSNDVTALVMELVEGPTLADRISDGAIPLPDALPIAKQIADALEVAHDQRIIHRDLKPANIKVRPEGTVKVLDFGLAKAGAAGADAVQLTNSPTLSSPAMATAPGVILGTAAYMAPEQAKGRPADRRADMWAFGCVLYEMLTGRQTFSGEDVTEVLASVLRGEPGYSALPKATPPAIETLIRRCLTKDPRQRLADASAARLDLDDAITGRASVDEPRARRGRRAPFVVASLIGVTLLVAGAILGWMLRPRTPPSPGVPARLEIVLPVGDELDLFNNNLALSPDGRTVAYIAAREGISRLYVRALDSFEASPLAGTDGAFHPFFSPDARWVGFFAQGKMKKIPVGGGSVQAIVDAGPNGGASWDADGTIVYAPSAISGTAGLARVSAEGGQPTVVTTPDVAKGEYSHRYPQILPGGRAVLFTALSGFGWDESRLEAIRLDTGERRLLVRGGHTGRYVPGGRLLYHRAGAIYAVPLDPDRLEVDGESPVAIADHAILNFGTTGAPFAVSDTGSVAYVPAPGGRRQFERRLMWTDRQGRPEPLAAPVRNYHGAPAVSPDGRQVAVVHPLRHCRTLGVRLGARVAHPPHVRSIEQLGTGVDAGQPTARLSEQPDGLVEPVPADGRRQRAGRAADHRSGQRDTRVVVTKWAGARVRTAVVRHGIRHLHTVARWRPRAAPIHDVAGQRTRAAVFSRRAVGGVRLGRVGRTSGVCRAVSRPGTPMADFHRRRRRPAVESEGRRSVLRERNADDGRGREGGNNIQRGQAAGSLQRSAGPGRAGRPTISQG
jgi:eukaryotic-like serine/threonine-protein kinase